MCRTIDELQDGRGGLVATTARILTRTDAWTESMQRTLGRWAATLLERVGTHVLQTLTEFSRSAGPGSMITIKRTRDGFTAQVTGPIVGGTPEPVTVESLTTLVEEID